MDTDVRPAMDRTNWNQWLKNNWIQALRMNGIEFRQRRATHRDGYRMLAGVARLQMDCFIVLVVMRCGPLMLVCGKAVMVLGMIVIGVRVDVQRRDLAGGRGQHQSDQDCN